MCHKTQKFPAFEAGDELFQGYFAWFSSIGSHMGQQTCTAWRLIHLCRHKNAPLTVNFEYYTMRGGKKSREKPAFAENVGRRRLHGGTVFVLPECLGGHSVALFEQLCKISGIRKAAILRDGLHLQR